jgi:hypothetical protein
MENKEEQFNKPRVVVDFEGHRKRKKERAEKEEIEVLRNEVEGVKREVKERIEKKEKRGTSFLSGGEILDVDPDELAASDLLLYKKVKDFKKDKTEFEDLFTSISKHKIRVFNHIVEKKKAEGYDPTGDFPLSDAAGDSRWAFMTWLMNKSLAEYGRKKSLEKKEEKGDAA